MKQSKCYISGAITNEPHYEFYFACAEYCVMQMGYQPVNPLNITPFLWTKRWTCYMIADLWTLMFCPTAYFMRNWTESKGARIEMKWAKLLRKHIIYEKEEARVVQTLDVNGFSATAMGTGEQCAVSGARILKCNGSTWIHVTIEPPKNRLGNIIMHDPSGLTSK